MLSKTLTLIKIYVAVAHSGKYVLRYMSVQLLHVKTGGALQSETILALLDVNLHQNRIHVHYPNIPENVTEVCWHLKKNLTFSRKITRISQIAKVFKKKRKEKNNIALTWKSNISSYIFSICAYPCHGGTFFFPFFKNLSLLLSSALQVPHEKGEHVT